MTLNTQNHAPPSRPLIGGVVVSANCGPGDLLRRPRIDYLIAFLIFFAITAQSLSTMNRVGISWDEPYYFTEAKSYASWLKSWGSGGSFRRSVREAVFTFHPKKDTHPTLAKLSGALTYLCFRNWLGEFRAYRFYAPLLFGILLALCYLRASRDWSRGVGLVAVLTLFTHPHFFTHGHIGATEMPLCWAWFLTVWAFEESLRRKYLAFVAGLCWGLAMSVKFTGFLLPIPLIFWSLIFERKGLLRTGVIMLFTGPLWFLLLQPEMWDHPIAGIHDFVGMSLSRRQLAPIHSFFLGRFYIFSAPWYYAPLMFLFTTQVVTLLFFLVGLGDTLAHPLKDKAAVSWVIHFGFLMFITMLPGSPTYNGVRLFLPAFIFIGLLAGKGWVKAAPWLAAKAPSRMGQSGPWMISALLVIMLLVGTSAPLARVYPFGLEYYNGLVGGSSGARRLGLEITYWWTALNQDGLKRVNQAIPDGQVLRFFPMLDDQWQLYKELGLIRSDITITHGNEFRFLLLLSKPYPGYEPYFAFLHLAPDQLRIVAEQDLDGVPLWILYERMPAVDGT